MPGEYVIGKFRCTTPSGGDLCFNGGSCVRNETLDIEYCVCPEGWQADNLNFHQPNCTLPNNILLIIFVIVAVTTFICLYLLYRVRPKAKGKALFILNWACIILVLTMMQSLTLLLEGGYYIATPLSVGVTIVSACPWANATTEMIAIPIFGVHPQIQASVRRSLRIMFSLIAAGVAILSITLSALAKGDEVVFNRMVAVFNLSLFAFEIIFGLVVVRYGEKLKRVVRSTNTFQNSEQKRVELFAKIRALQLGALSVSMGQILSVVYAIVLLAIGSAPFFWVVWLSVIVFTTPAITKSTLDFFNEDASRRVTVNISDPNRTSKSKSNTVPQDKALARESGVSVPSSPPIQE